MKKNYLFILLSLVLNNLQSQSYSWAKSEGLWQYDYGMGITTDNTGNVYVAGKYELNAIFSGSTLSCAGNHDIYIAKYSSAGALSWIHTGGGLNGDYARAVACDGNNYVYITGEIEGYGNLITFPGSTITLNAIGDNDVFVAKYNLAGNLLWAKSAGGYYNEKAEGVSYDNAGNVFICGHYSDTATFGGVTTIYGTGVDDIFIAKYDANGNFVWVQRAGGPGKDEVKSIKCDATGNVYVTGFYSNGAVFGAQTYSTTSGVYHDTFLAKYDNNGTLLWVKTAGGSYDDVAWGLTIDNAGLIYITGEFNGSAYFGTTQLIVSGNADIFITCYDALGNVLWAKKAGGPLVDRARGIGTDGNNLYITGQFGSTATFGTFSVNASDSSDVFFASLNNSGTFTGVSSVGGVADTFEPAGFESGTSICADANGNVFATGALLDGGIFGSATVSPYARTDVFITKITQLGTVNITENSTQKNIQIYPNPGNGNFTIDFEQAINQNINVNIYNYLGQNIDAKINRLLSKLNIDLSTVEDGMYFVEIKDASTTIASKKIMVNN